MPELYSKKLIDIFTHPKNVGKMKNPDGVGSYTSPVCGDMLTVYLKIKDNKIIDSSFETWGCMVSVATASVITELAKGKTLEEAMRISSKDMEEAIGEIPPIKAHCIEMTLKALQNAIQDFRKKKIR